MLDNFNLLYCYVKNTTIAQLCANFINRSISCDVINYPAWNIFTDNFSNVEKAITLLFTALLLNY